MDFIKQFGNSYPKSPEDLNDRAEIYNEFFLGCYSTFKAKKAKQVLADHDAIDIAKSHSNWADEWIKFTWWFVLQEELELMQEVAKSIKHKQPYLKSVIPEKLRKKEELKSVLSADQNQPLKMDPAERSYYTTLLKDLEKEIQGLQQEFEIVESIDEADFKKNSDSDDLLKHFLVFARGGFGREELTFSSDVDLAYVLDVQSTESSKILIIQELIKRMEELFRSIPIDLASQYFELGEDLSRFNRTDMLHSIPSILEGRAIVGNKKLLPRIKSEFMEVSRRQRLIRFLQHQMDGLKREDDEFFYIKEGFGGVRHFQYVQWMVLVVENQEYVSSMAILELLLERKWISETDKKNLAQALEFYLDLRNFIGLFDYFKETMDQPEYASVFEGKAIIIDYLNATAALAYLKLKNRFLSVDSLDRYRLHSIKSVSTIAQSIVDGMLDRTVVEQLPGFVLFKHLGSNRIIRFETLDKKAKTAWNLKSQSDRKKSDDGLQLDMLKELFTNFNNLLDLFKYIGKTGHKLSRDLIAGFSSLLEVLSEVPTEAYQSKVKDFVFELFTSENASSAIKQMMDIASPLSRDGNMKTLLGLFIPETNHMRYLLRNLEVHEFPLCIHSQKALKRVESEIETSQKEEPEFWHFISENDLFALKWSTFFHDLGKINPYRNHEKYGPILSSEMLVRLGWEENDDILPLTRLLIENHQSIVRFSQLSTFLDQGILKLFELAQRDPRKVLLLYLINVSDFKSVNTEMSQRAAHLENFFDKAMSILREFKRDELPPSPTDEVNDYLDRKVDEIRTSVLVELLLRQSCNKSLEDVIINPLAKISPEELKRLNKQRSDLENALGYLKLAELDASSLEKHRVRFIQIIKGSISEENIVSIVAGLSHSWEWFFTSVPNRYLLSSSVETLTTQLQEFEANKEQNVNLSYIKGDQGEYDSILFHFIGEKQIQAKLAYALGWQGFNIESGKINKIQYGDGRKGFVGYLRVSSKDRLDRITNIELKNVIDNLVIPPLNPQPVSSAKKVQTVQVQHFIEKEKGYLIKEVNKEHFNRVPERYVAVKISLFDAPFAFYKILRSFEAFGVFPEQTTITTIGNQIIDYFYLTDDNQKILKDDEFKRVLQMYIDAEITIT